MFTISFTDFKKYSKFVEKSTTMSKGKLFLIPTPLGEATAHTIPEYVITRAHQINSFIAERAKTARRFLKEIKTPIPFADMTFYELNKRTDPNELASFLEPALSGIDIGLLSEAGVPGVADPGAEIVALAHQLGIEVVPLVGPSSILLALMASGLNGQRFAFHGYLPIKRPERTNELKKLEKIGQQLKQTQIFIETPYRNNEWVKDAINCLSSNTFLCIAVDLSLSSQYIATKSVKDWKKGTIPDLHKRPAIFLIGQLTQGYYK